MVFTFEFFRIRPGDKAHAILERISQVVPDFKAAKVRAKSLWLFSGFGVLRGGGADSGRMGLLM
jgi:hypothetical protein